METTQLIPEAPLLTPKTVNVANTNVDSGTVWLVIVNDAGNWVGEILGAPGSDTASSGIALSEDANGNVTASNNNNGAGSTNNANDNSSSNSSTTQNNNADINNNVNLSAEHGWK